MLKPQGYAITTRDGKTVEEEDSFTCAHCNRINFIVPGHIVQASKCIKCDRYVCAPGECAIVFNDESRKVENGSCVPFERKLESMERRAHMLRRILR